MEESDHSPSEAGRVCQKRNPASPSAKPRQNRAFLAKVRLRQRSSAGKLNPYLGRNPGVPATCLGFVQGKRTFYLLNSPTHLQIGLF